MCFSLLSKPLQKYIWSEEWDHFTPIQDAAISRIIQTENNYILASETASGKTEAAFLPILSLLDFNESGVKILYISPLRALINDQFKRVEDMCGYLDVKITKWHSDVSRSHKEKLIKKPQGILQITPESLESFFLNHPEYINHLFNKLQFVIIDEIHTFLGTARGVHLQSLLARIKSIIKSKPRFIGLSATLSNFDKVKEFFGEKQITKVLRVSNNRTVKFNLRHYNSEARELPLEILIDCYQLTQRYKSLIFANSRGKVEETAVKLKKISKKKTGHENYFTHHSSISKNQRESIENNLKDGKILMAVVCTSTLELGIDIGSIDLIVQIDSTFSVSSLVQRLGRSGRGTNQPSILQMYTTNKWSLLQSVACIELFKDKFIDMVEEIRYPIDIVFQQILSILTEHRGIKRNELIRSVKDNYAFSMIEEKDMGFLIDWMIENDYIEDLVQELILGYKGERIVNSRNIYSAFTMATDFTVIFKGSNIGFLPYSQQLSENINVFLGAKIWKITSINFDKKKIYVEPANDGNPPVFFGNGGIIHPKIREKMKEIVFSNDSYNYIDNNAEQEFLSLKEDFSHININSYSDRPYIRDNDMMKLFTFTGTRINRTLHAVFNSYLNGQVNYNEMESCLILKSTETIEDLIFKIRKLLENPDVVLDNLPKNILLSKWAEFLPKELQKKWLKKNYFDFEETIKFIENVNFVS